MRNRTYKQIEASRNSRLWITSVILPVATMALTVGTSLYNNNPEFRIKVNNFINNPKEYIKARFGK